MEQLAPEKISSRLWVKIGYEANMFETISSTKGTWIIVKKEFERSVLLGVRDLAKDSEWGSPSFAQPKSKSNQVCFISDFRNLNKPLKRKTYQMPKITEMLLKS